MTLMYEMSTPDLWIELVTIAHFFIQTVVDAHQKWCGPCTAITGMLKRTKMEIGDDLLKFATVGLWMK